MHFYSFVTFPMLRAESYKAMLSDFIMAASIPPSGDDVDSAIDSLARTQRELASGDGLPEDEGIDGVALRMIAAEMLYYEMRKVRRESLLVEALSLVVDSFLRIKDKIEVKIT
jgi:hypothetical protein